MLIQTFEGKDAFSIASQALLAVSPTSPILDGVNTSMHAVLVEELLSRRGNSAGWDIALAANIQPKRPLSAP